MRVDEKLKKELRQTRAPGFIGVVLMFLGIFSAANPASTLHPLLDDPRVAYGLIVVGVVLWLYSMKGTFNFIRGVMTLARHPDRMDSEQPLSRRRMTAEEKAEQPDNPRVVVKQGNSPNILIYILIGLFIAAFAYETLVQRRAQIGVDDVTQQPEPVINKVTPEPVGEISPAVQFYNATARSDLATMQQLLPQLQPGEINIVFKGMTPIMKASSLGNSQLVQFLLANGADPNKRGSSKRTALQYAAERNRLEVARLLVKHGADINGTDKSRLSPLTMAADRRYRDFALYLIDRGADVNIQHVQGWTALIDAARNGDLVLVKRLVEAGADINARTRNGWNAMDFARHNKHTEVEQYLMARYEK